MAQADYDRQRAHRSEDAEEHRADAGRGSHRGCVPADDSVGLDDMLGCFKGAIETTCSNIPPSINSAPLALHGMAKAFAELAANGQTHGLGHQGWLGLLLDREASWRQDKRCLESTLTCHSRSRRWTPHLGTAFIRDKRGKAVTRLGKPARSVAFTPPQTPPCAGLRRGSEGRRGRALETI
jgi:hypothetical protein